MIKFTNQAFCLFCCHTLAYYAPVLITPCPSIRQLAAPKPQALEIIHYSQSTENLRNLDNLTPFAIHKLPPYRSSLLLPCSCRCDPLCVPLLCLLSFGQLNKSSAFWYLQVSLCVSYTFKINVINTNQGKVNQNQTKIYDKIVKMSILV